MDANGFDIRLLTVGSIEDHHAHLLRLDRDERCLCFAAGNDDFAVDIHCLRLIAAPAIIIGAYDDRQLRASVEIVADRTGRCGRATLAAESGFRSGALVKALMHRAEAESASHGLSHVDFIGVPGARPDGTERASAPVASSF